MRQEVLKIEMFAIRIYNLNYLHPDPRFLTSRSPSQSKLFPHSVIFIFVPALQEIKHESRTGRRLSLIRASCQSSAMRQKLLQAVIVQPGYALAILQPQIFWLVSPFLRAGEYLSFSHKEQACPFYKYLISSKYPAGTYCNGI